MHMHREKTQRWTERIAHVHCRQIYQKRLMLVSAEQPWEVDWRLRKTRRKIKELLEFFRSQLLEACQRD